MNLFVYSDESGVFDVVHNDFYVYAGLIFLSKEERDEATRKYVAAERTIAKRYPPDFELKASNISNNDKGKLFRSLNKYHRFGVVINENNVHKQIFASKKTKQRYLDYAYKIGLKNALQQIIKAGEITPELVEHLYVFVDEHTTATDGRYELREGLEQEFKDGTFNAQYDVFFPPILPAMKSVQLNHCNSEKKILIRSADVIANKIYHHAVTGNVMATRDNLYIKRLP